MNVEIAPCDFAAANHAATHWHYAGRMPMGKTFKVGLWEDGSYRGCVVFGSGSGQLPRVGFQFGLRREQTVELARVAMREHVTPVSQVVTAGLRYLLDANPQVQLLVSFADPQQGHAGRIYQALNWTYNGTSQPTKEFYYGGRWVHARATKPPAGPGGITPDERQTVPTRWVPGKFRYLWSPNKRIRRLLAKQALPYPDDDTVAVQVSEVRHRSTRPEGYVRSVGTAP